MEKNVLEGVKHGFSMFSKHIESRFLAGLSISLVPSELICLNSMNNCKGGVHGGAVPAAVSVVVILFMISMMIKY